MRKSRPRVLVVGSGLAGALLALRLGQRGFEVSLFERRPGPRRPRTFIEETLNIVISARSLEIFERSGLGVEVSGLVTKLEGRTWHARDGSQVFEANAPGASAARGPFRQAPGACAVSKAALEALLLERLGSLENVEIHFDRELAEADVSAGHLELKSSSGARYGATAEVVVAADGAGSGLRRQLVAEGRIDETVSPSEIGYKVLDLLPASSDGRELDARTLHFWPRSGSVLVAIPNRSGNFACALFIRHRGAPSLAGLRDEPEVRRFFEREYPDALPWLASFVEDMSSRPAGRLVTSTCEPWHVERAVLLGDACHAMLPFAGQGANTALEDAWTLAGCLDELGPDWRGAFSEFARRRKAAADEVARFSAALVPLFLDTLGALMPATTSGHGSPPVGGEEAVAGSTTRNPTSLSR